MVYVGHTLQSSCGNMVVNPRRDTPHSAGTLSTIRWWPEVRLTMQPAGLQQNPQSFRVAASEMSVVRWVPHQTIKNHRCSQLIQYFKVITRTFRCFDSIELNTEIIIAHVIMKIPKVCCGGVIILVGLVYALKSSFLYTSLSDFYFLYLILLLNEK